ncbi:hydrogenase expression protein HypA [Streptomyces flavovirens]|uniref:hydrogenase expression protein HypA n=1 Tax=Streptomyces flavovirens TaxID=52258 RepID=UPI003D0E2482
MAREHDPSSHIPPRTGASSGASGASGSSPVSVRRAVPMSGAAGDPGDALTPGGSRGRKDTSPTSPATGPDAGTRGPTSESPETLGGSPEAEGSESGTPEGADTRQQTEGRAGGARAAGATDGGGTARGIGAPGPTAKGAAESASADSEETAVVPAATPSSPSATEPAAALAAAGGVGGSPDAEAAVAAAGSGGAGAGTHADDVPPGSRPKKPMLAAAAIVGAILISVPFLVAGQDDRKPEKDHTQNAAGTVLDTDRVVVPETYTSKSPSPSPTPSEEKEEKKETEKPSESPAPKPVIAPPPSTPKSKPAATVTAKAPLNTAAGALSSLAKNDPQGRHICYRAFVYGSGWQAPVCDGTMTGTTGQGKQITALNIAVWNVGGSSANALLNDPSSTSGNAKWAPNWTAVAADGKDNYIGSSKKDAPFMTGFAMNIGKGSVCHTAKMRGGGWGSQFCKNARPEYMFVGTTANENWFEAVKLTV